MSADAKCPLCSLPLHIRDDEASCANGHAYNAAGLSVATNVVAARALWLAVHSMEDDAAGLAWRAQRTPAGEEADALLAECRAAREAAVSLRALAAAAEERLNALPYPGRVVRLVEPERRSVHD